MIMNDNILTEIKNQDYQSITERIQNSIIQKCSEYDKDGVIFGLSGGIDSAVIALVPVPVSTTLVNISVRSFITF